MSLNVLPLISRAFVDVPTNPFYFPSRPNSAAPQRMRVNGIYTQQMDNYAVTQTGWRQVTRYGSTFYGYTDLIRSNRVRNFFGDFAIYQPDSVRNFSQLEFVTDIISNRIIFVKLGNPVNMPLCHTGAIYTITGFLANYIDASGTFVLLNTYSGNVTGGGGTNVCKINWPFSYGYDSGWNGYGKFSPQEAGISQISDWNTCVQIDNNRVAQISSDKLNIYKVINQITAGDNCAYNYIFQNSQLLESYDIPSLFPGAFTYGYEYSYMNCPRANELIFSVSGLTYSTVTSRVFYFKWPGPTLQMVSVPAYRGSRWDVTLSDDYILFCDANSNYVTSPAMDYVSTDTLKLDVSFSIPAKTPPPEPVNKTNTIRKFNIDRTF